MNLSKLVGYLNLLLERNECEAVCRADLDYNIADCGGGVLLRSLDVRTVSVA